MNQEAQNKIVDLIVDAANKLGFAAERLWPQMVMMTFIKSLFWTIAIPLCLVVIAGICYYIYRRRKAVIAMDEGDRWAHNSKIENWTVALAVSLILFGLSFLFMGLIVWPDVFASAMYPEAATVQQYLPKK